MDYKHFFSVDTANFMRSPVRDIFKKVDLNSIYSFAGGYPSADTFPLEDIKELSAQVIEKYGATSLQYGATQGVMQLRWALSNRYKVQVDNIQITTSSQQGIDICARILLDPKDVVLTLNPSYLGALQSFFSYRADVQGITIKNNFIQDIETVINNCRAENKVIKYFYVIPDFQNPSGETLTLTERKALIDLSNKYDFLIVEDSPYKELRYEGEDIPSLYSLDNNRVIFLGSFSKIFAPGFRIGWVFANEEVLDKIYVCKQSLDLCPPVFDQYLTTEFLNSGKLDANLQKSKLLYKEKRDLILQCLMEYMPKNISWTTPQGGLFLFLTLPKTFDAVRFYDIALNKGVAYVAGNFFYTDNSHKNTMRLNFSFMSKERILEGIKLLSLLITTELNK